MSILTKVSKSALIDGSLKIKDLAELFGISQIIKLIVSFFLTYIAKYFNSMDWITFTIIGVVIFLLIEVFSLAKLLIKQDREQKLCIYDLSLRLEYYKTIMQQNESQFNDIHRQTLKSIKQRIGENADEKLQMLGIKLENVNDIAINLNMNKPRIEAHFFIDSNTNMDNIAKQR